MKINEGWRKLRALFEDEEARSADLRAAEERGAPLTGAPLSRAEMRRRRKQDFRERLRGMMQPDGSLSHGVIKFINLDPIRAAVGDRWQTIFPKVELMAEAIIRKEVGEENIYLTHHDQGFVLIFTDPPDLESSVADHWCLAIFEEIRKHLLGSEKIVVLPDFDIDPDEALKALDDDLPVRLVLAKKQPPGAWTPPGLTGVVPHRAELPEPAGMEEIPSAPEENDDDGSPPWMALLPENDRGKGEAILITDRTGSREDPTGAWNTRTKDDPQGRWADSRDRDLKTDFDVPVTGEKPPESTTFPTSYDKPERDGKWVEGGQGAPDGANPDWGKSRDRPTGEDAELSSGAERPPGSPADWGHSYDKRRNATDWRPMERDEASPRTETGDVTFVVTDMGEPKNQAHLVKAERKRFHDLSLGYRTLWDARTEIIATYFAQPALEGAPVGPPVDLTKVPSVVEDLPALDLAIIDGVVRDLTPLIEAGAKLVAVIPVSFATLTRKAERQALVDRWAAVPEALRRVTRFQCYPAAADIGSAQLLEITSMLRQISREPIFWVGTRNPGLDRLTELRAQTVAIDASPTGDASALVTATIAQARRLRLAPIVYGLKGKDARIAALKAGAAMIEGPVLPDGSRVRAQPVKVPVATIVTR